MPWLIRTPEQASFVEACLSGVLTRRQLAGAFADALSELKKWNRSGLLIDGTGTEGAPSLADLYFLTDLLESSGLASSLRKAVALPRPALPSGDPNSWNARFFELTVRHRGLQLRLFDDPEHARAWLDNSGGAVSSPA